jgi:hypothetical protein
LFHETSFQIIKIPLSSELPIPNSFIKQCMSCALHTENDIVRGTVYRNNHIFVIMVRRVISNIWVFKVRNEFHCSRSWFMRYSLSVTCGRSLVFLVYSGFLHTNKKEIDLPDIMEMLLIAESPVTITRFIYNKIKIKLCHED